MWKFKTIIRQQQQWNIFFDFIKILENQHDQDQN